MKKKFSLDAETNGLWGQAFAIGAIVLDGDTEINRFVARCPIQEDIDPWVSENVIPQMDSIPITHDSYESMLKDFIQFYLDNKQDADIIVHMGLPVEARLFLDAHTLGYLGDWDAPYPLIDISAYPEINDSVDNYNTSNGIIVPDFDGRTHNPLYDSMAAALAYNHYHRDTIPVMVQEYVKGKPVEYMYGQRVPTYSLWDSVESGMKKIAQIDRRDISAKFFFMEKWYELELRHKDGITYAWFSTIQKGEYIDTNIKF